MLMSKHAFRRYSIANLITIDKRHMLCYNPTLIQQIFTIPYDLVKKFNALLGSESPIKFVQGVGTSARF